MLYANYHRLLKIENKKLEKLALISVYIIRGLSQITQIKKQKISEISVN